MKLLLVSRRYYPEVIGGGQISAHAIAQALVCAGHDVRVLTFNANNKRIDEKINGVTIVRLPIRELTFFPRLSNLEWMYYEMRRQTQAYLSEFTPDLIHALNGESVPAIAPLSKKVGIPFVATVNGPWFFCFPGEGVDSKGNDCLGCTVKQRFTESILKWGCEGFLSKIKAFFYFMYSYPHMYLIQKSLRQASMLLPVSNGFAHRLIKLGYPKEKIRVTHNPMTSHRKVFTQIKQQLSIPSNNKIILFAGRLTETKGVQNMIKALTNLPTVHAIIVGKGPYEQVLKQLSQDLRVANRVHFTGFINPDNIKFYYSVADIVIMAGTFYEALGRMLLEACSYGVPVIATNKAGNPDIIEHGKNGYLLETQEIAELVECILKILKYPARAKAMGIAGQKKIATEFVPSRIAKDLTLAYQAALEYHTLHSTR